MQRLLEVDESNEPEMRMTRVIYGSRCPLHQAAAAKENRLATCKLLLDFDPDQLNVATNDGSKPMHMLAQSEDDQAAVLNAFISKFEEQQKELPAEKRKSVSQMLKEKKKDGSLLLHLACSAGLSSMVTDILKHDPTQALVVDGSVRTCLHLAAEKGHLKVMQELVKVEGITFGTKDRKGCTCLALAAIGGHADVVKLLIAKDGNTFSKVICVVTSHIRVPGQSLLRVTFENACNDFRECVSGNQLKVRNSEAKTPLDLAAEHGSTPSHWTAAAALLDADPSLLHAKPEEPKKEPEGEEASKPKPKLAGNTPAKIPT